MEILFVAIGVFGLVWGFLFLALAPKTAGEEKIVRRRLQAIAVTSGGQTSGQSSLLLESDKKETFWESVARFFLGEQNPMEKYTAMHRLLHQAGYPGRRAVRIFWGVRIFLAIAFAAGAFFWLALSVTSFSKVLLGVAASAGVGYLLPHLYVRRKAKFRKRDIQETFPDTLDLLVICVEAGMGMDSALVRVANEQAEQGLIVGKELQLMTQEVQAGLSRREALSRMADWLDIEEVHNLTALLIQTDELGGSIARALRVHADTMRQKRSQKAEEAARKMVIKLVFPLVFFILPALFLVVLGPPGLALVKYLSAPVG